MPRRRRAPQRRRAVECPTRLPALRPDRRAARQAIEFTARRDVPFPHRRLRIVMLENLTERLSRVAKTLRGEARLTDANIQEALREVRFALLEADVALPVVKDFIATLREKAVGQEVVGSLTPGQALLAVVQREL